MEDRNRNYASIMRNLNFSSRGWYDVQSQVDEVDDHVKRKVSVSPGWNSIHLLPAFILQARAGHFESMPTVLTVQECAIRGCLASPGGCSARTERDCAALRWLTSARGAALLPLDQGCMVPAWGCILQIAC